MTCTMTFYISLSISKLNNFLREKNIFFYRMKTNFFIYIAIFVLLILRELRKMYA